MKIHILASGSTGNCALVEAGTTRVLVDAGLSGREIERRLATVGCRAEDLAGILITHEHADHVRGAGILARRHGIRVHLAEETHKAERRHLGELPQVHHFHPGRRFPVADLVVHPFSTPHTSQAGRCADPVAFVFFHGSSKGGYATDLGHYPCHLMAHHLARCNLLVLEFNHDPEMLRNGPYPEPLKQWIRQRGGHLSNEQGAHLLEDILRHGFELEALALAHLSEKNNTPELAARAARGVLERFRVADRVELQVAGPDKIVSLSLRG